MIVGLNRLLKPATRSAIIRKGQHQRSPPPAGVTLDRGDHHRLALTMPECGIPLRTRRRTPAVGEADDRTRGCGRVFLRYRNDQVRSVNWVHSQSFPPPPRSRHIAHIRTPARLIIHLPCLLTGKKQSSNVRSVTNMSSPSIWSVIEVANHVE